MSFSDVATYVLFISVFFIAFTQVYLTSFRQLQTQEQQLTTSQQLIDDIKNTKITFNTSRYNSATGTVTLLLENIAKNSINPTNLEVYINNERQTRYAKKWSSCTSQSTIGCGEIGWGDASFETNSLQALFHFNNDSEYGEDDITVTDFASAVTTGNYGAELTSGKFEYAYRFDGTNNISSAVSSAHNFNGSAIIIAWIYSVPSQTNQTIISKGNAYTLWLDKVGNIMLSSPTTDYNSSRTVSQNHWDQIVAIISSPNITIRLNGNVVYSAINDLSFPSETTQNLTIGYSQKEGGFVGKIDEVAVYSNPSAITSLELQQLYLKGYQSQNPSLWDADEFSQITFPVTEDVSDTLVTVKDISGISATAVIS